MELIFAGMTDLFTLTNVIYIALGICLGIFVGAIPGLGHPIAVAIAVPMTFYLSPLTAIAFLVGIQKGGTYGGSISSILLNTPGSPEAAVTAFDGFPLAKKGKAEKALKMSLYSSVFGDTFSDLVLIAVAAPVASIALKLGPVEVASIIIFALTIIAAFAGQSMIKALIAAAFGLFLTTVGVDPVTGDPRLAFGSLHLESGIPMTAIFIGALALSEIFIQMETSESHSTESIKLIKEGKKEDRTISWLEFRGCLRTLFRSSFIGTAIGALPGLGITIASFLGYAAARNASKHPEEFGKGSLEGIAAPEAANNAVLGANLIPVFSLGIPGNLSAALLLGAFMIHGVSPGPLMFEQQGRLIYGIYGALIISNLLNLVIGRFGLKFFAKVLLIPKRIIFPLIVFLCMVGVYLTENSLFAVGMMFVFAFLGYLMKKLDFSFMTFIIGFVLGPILELALRQTLIISKNNPMILFNHPISLAFLILTVISIWRLGFGSKRFLTGLSGDNKNT